MTEVFLVLGALRQLYHFVVEATNAPYPSIASSDERILQLSQFMNRCMEKEKQTRRRQVMAGVGFDVCARGLWQGRTFGV